MSRTKKEFASGKVRTGVVVDLNKVSEENRQLIELAFEKAKEKGIDIQKASVSMGKINADEIFINIWPAPKTQGLVMGGGGVRVQFKRTGKIYHITDVGVWE